MSNEAGLAAGALTDAQIKVLEGIYEKYASEPGSTIPVLQEMQDSFGYVPEEAVYWMADQMGVPTSTFFGVATFYALFHLKPRGKNIVTVCCGTACHVKGAEKLMSRARTELGLEEEHGTTKDMSFTLEKVACLGTCSMAPAVLINKKTYGGMKPEALAREIKHLKKEA